MQKKFYKITTLILALAAFILVGCSNIVSGTTSLDDTSETIKKCILTIGISNYDSLGSDSLTKTILPTDWSAADKASFTFKISGKSSQGEAFAEEVITFTSGTASKALSYSIWELTLTAYKNDVAVLQGHSFADLTNGGGSISFRLVSGTLKTKGTVKLKGTYTDANSVVTKYVMGLYKFDTGVAIKELEVNSPATTSFDFTKDSDGSSDITIDPGTYIFAIKFYRGAAKDIQCGYWSDMVIVAAGNITTKTDIVIPDIIQKAPTVPANLKAYLKDGSETEAGYYTVRLEWEDKSINEENFVLYVKEYSALADASPVDFKILGVKEDLANKKEIFWGSDTRVDGTLLSGSTWCELKLPTGRLFDVSLTAQNFAGESATACARVAATSKTNYTPYDIAGNMRINRVKMSYILDGGTLKKFENAAEKLITGTYVEYMTYSGTDFNVFGYTDAATYPLKTNSEANTSYPRLIKDQHPFQKWLITGTTTEATTNTAFHDLSVTADYKLTYTINYTIPTYSDMESGRVTICYDDDDDGTCDVDCINDIVLAGASATNQNPPIEFTVLDATTGQIVFDSYRIRIDQSDIYTGSSNTFTYSKTAVTGLSSGTHTVNVFAKKQNTDEWYSYTCAITISR